MENKKMSELADGILQYLSERGNTEKSINHYRYILNGMVGYCNNYNDGHFDESAIAVYLKDKYQIPNINEVTRKDGHFESSICRTYKMLSDPNQGNAIKSRYIKKRQQLESFEFNNTLTEFVNLHTRYGYTSAGIKSYICTAIKFLKYCELQGISELSGINVQQVNEFILTLKGYKKATVKNIIGGLRIFLRFLYQEEYCSQNLGDGIVPLRVKGQLRIPSVWRHEEVIKLLSVIDRGNPYQSNASIPAGYADDASVRILRPC